MSETEHEPQNDDEPEAPEAPDEPTEDEIAEEYPRPGQTGDEPSPEEQTAQGPSPEEWEERFRQIALKAATFRRALDKILGEDALDLTPCPLCTDAIPGFVNAHDAGKVADEIVGAVQAFIGYEAPATLNKSRLNERCTTCSGLGQLKTGSLVPNYAERVCDECGGFGYRGPGNPKDAPGLVLAPPADAPNGPPEDAMAAALASIKGLETP